MQEQEIEKKARKQFKGLFDKRPGEISEVGAESGEDEGLDEQNQNGRGSGATEGDKDGALDYEEQKVGLLGRIWPAGRRIFTALGLNRCTIL